MSQGEDWMPSHLFTKHMNCCCWCSLLTPLLLLVVLIPGSLVICLGVRSFSVLLDPLFRLPGWGLERGSRRLGVPPLTDT